METPVSVDPAEINPAVATPEEMQSLPNAGTERVRSPRSEYLLWLFVFLAVFGFGYLSSTRREAISKFVAQVSDVVKDFRGYDPEV